MSGMQLQMSKLTAAAVAVLASASAAFAHPGHGAVGVAAGFAHPFSGADHMIAMLAIGFWAARMGGKAVWAMPAAFVAVMATGFAWALAGHSLGYVEQAILISMIVLPIVAVVARKATLGVALAVTAGFALFHGFAHGLELPADSTSWQFAGGFVLATAVLHSAGIAVGMLAGAGWVTRTRT